MNPMGILQKAASETGDHDSESKQVKITIVPSKDNGKTYEIVAESGPFKGERVTVLNVRTSGAYFNVM